MLYGRQTNWVDVLIESTLPNLSRCAFYMINYKDQLNRLLQTISVTFSVTSKVTIISESINFNTLQENNFVLA